MTFSIPQLDNLEFEQLAEQARALIPRYAPEWTDHNVHDPGITILELLAWIVDQQLYQVGLVSDRHLRAFAALLGVRPKAAQPARGLIWPNKQESTPNQHVILAESDLRRGERVSSIQQPDLSFVLDADIHLTAAQPSQSRVQTLSSERAIDLTHFFQQPRASFDFQPERDNDAVLEIAFTSPLVGVGENPIALGIEVDPVPSAHADAPTPWGPLFIEYRTDRSPWQPVTIVEDRTFSLARTGVVLVQIPADKAAQASSLRFRFDRGFYPVPLRIVRVEVNVLPIVQLEQQRQRVVGLSNGMPDQAFPLELKGLPEQATALKEQKGLPFPEPLHIEVAQGGQFVAWAERDDLAQNAPAETVYQRDAAGGQIIFGNGVNGAIPPVDAQIRHTAYHTTQGAQGNVTSDLDWRVTNASVQGALFGTNPQPLVGGEDAWELDRLMAEARKRVLERQVMLSNQDLLRTVESLDGFAVARADLLVRYHPVLPEQALQGTRTVVVTPWRDKGSRASTTMVTERYLKEVTAAIEPFRVLGERLTVITHQRVSVRIKARLLVAPDKDGNKIKNEAIKRLNARLSDITVPESGYQSWPLGRDVTHGEIKGLLAAIPDVIAVPACALARDDDAFAEEDILRLKRDEVAVGSDHEITIEFLEPG